MNKNSTSVSYKNMKYAQVRTYDGCTQIQTGLSKEDIQEDSWGNKLIYENPKITIKGGLLYFNGILRTCKWTGLQGTIVKRKELDKLEVTRGDFIIEETRFLRNECITLNNGCYWYKDKIKRYFVASHFQVTYNDEEDITGV